MTHGEDDDEPCISKEQMICRNSHCRNEADVVYRGLQLWDLEPCPKEESREMVTTKQHFRMIAQAMGTGHRAGNATRRNPAHCTRAWAGAVSKVEQKELTVPGERVTIKLGDTDIADEGKSKMTPSANSYQYQVKPLQFSILLSAYPNSTAVTPEPTQGFLKPE